MSDRFGRLKGFADLFGEDLAAFRKMEATARIVFERHEFAEIRPPILEATELFQRGIGAETDVVQKEMFTFKDRKERSLTMRPEATAGVLRAAIEAGLAKFGLVSRLYTIGPMFRFERPQKGRMRQFHQINAECLGSDSPFVDAELISMLLHFLRELDLKNLRLKINSLGCKKCRPGYVARLSEFLASIPEEELCEDCLRRKNSNPLRTLDCKICQDKLANAPAFRENICGECDGHFKAVLGLLNAAGIEYSLDDRLVRGLDYYCRTTFEVVSGEIGAQTAVAGGGRYDGLVRELGGGDVPGAGFACGMERLALLLPAPQCEKPDFHILGLDMACMDAAFLLARRLRNAGFTGSMNYSHGSMKSLLRQACNSGAGICLILGPDELAAGEITFKNMADGEQRRIALDRVDRELESIREIR